MQTTLTVEWWRDPSQIATVLRCGDTEAVYPDREIIRGHHKWQIGGLKPDREIARIRKIEAERRRAFLAFGVAVDERIDE